MLYGMVAGMTRLSRWMMRHKLERATIGNVSVDAEGAATIPVLATFAGLRGLPWWYAVAINNAKPLLVVERRGELLTFAANLGSVPLAAHVLNLIPATVPLSTRAATIRSAIYPGVIATRAKKPPACCPRLPRHITAKYLRVVKRRR